MAAPEEAGLVRGTDTTAVVPKLADALSRSKTPQRVEQYELTGNCKKYFQQVLVDFGQTGEFCYDQKGVDTVVKWTEPTQIGPYTQSDVTYLYKIVNLANG